MKEEGIIEYETLAVMLKDLEEYGADVVRYINKETSEKALLVLSGASTSYIICFEITQIFLKKLIMNQL